MLRKKICTISLLTLSMMITNISPISAIRYDNHLSIKQNKQSTPILEVTFDDETANDISGNNNHGTAMGSVQYVEGIKGKAIHIKNEGVAYTSAKAKQYVDFKTPSDLQFGSDSFSIMFWIKQNGNKMTDGSIMGNKDWSTGRNKGFAIAVYDNKQTLNFTANGASRADTEGIDGLSDHEWHHVTAVFDRNGNMLLYVDGKEKAKKDLRSQLGKSIDAGNLILGADGLKQYSIEDIYIDELSIFRDVVSEDEIKEMNKEYFFNHKIIQLRSKVQEYETLLQQMDTTQNKKDTFLEEIQNVKDEMDFVTELSGLDALMEQLQTAYNAFCQPDQGNAEFIVMSDTHVSASASSSSNLNLINALDEIKTRMPHVNLVINAGDFASDGGNSEVDRYFQTIGQYTSDFQFMTALGNHDVRWNSGWDDMYDRYMRHNGPYMGDTKNVYYDKWVDGYHHIVLNTEYDLKDRAFISNEQLEWLDETMAQGAEQNKPIFVVLHQPLRDTYYNSNEWDEGMQDFALKEVLRKYPQTILFSGHLHNGLGKGEVLETDFGTVVDVPGFLRNDSGDPRGQLGYHVAVYDDKVQLSMRDFRDDKWLPAYNYVIDLHKDNTKNGKVLDVNFDNQTADDISGKNNHGTIIGDVSFTEGVKGKAIHIKNDDKNIASQYVDFGTLSDVQFGTDDYSILFWYKGSKAIDIEESIISNKNWDNASNPGFTIGNFTDPRPGFGLNFTAEGCNRKDTERSSAMIDGNWHHIAATFDRDGDMKIYVDGAMVQSKDISEDAEKSIDVEGLPLILGADGNLQYPIHNSYIDELKVYRKAIGAAELETVVMPIQVETTENAATITWSNLNSKLEPAYILINDDKFEVPSNTDHYYIDNLTANTEYSINIVTREKSIKRNLCDAYTITFTTKASKADTTALRSKLAELEQLVQWDYTKASWEVLQEAFVYAKSVLELQNPTQEELDAALQELQNAYEQLEFETDITRNILKNVIDKTNDLINNDKLDHLAPNVVSMIQACLANAKVIYEQVDATNEDYLQAWMELANALHYLDFIADKNDLMLLINVCDAIDLNEYIFGVEAFEEALSLAKDVYENENVLQNTIDQAYRALSKAKDDLIKEDVDKAILLSIVTSIKETIGDGSKYQQDDNWAIFQEALANAERVLADDHAVQTDIHTVLTSLTNAYLNIRLLPDEALLQQLRDFINLINHTDLRQYSVDIAHKALFVKGKASDMLNHPNAFENVQMILLQAEMDEVIHMLQNNKVAPLNPVNTNKDAVDAKPEDNKTVKETLKANPIKTGDMTNLAGISFTLLLSAGLLMYVKRRNRA